MCKIDGHWLSNSLRPSDAYMRRKSNHHWFRWWLVAWSAPNHYLNQCWNIVNWTLRNKIQWNSNRNPNIFIQENALENVVCEMASISSRPQCINCFWFLRMAIHVSIIDHIWKKYLVHIVSVIHVTRLEINGITKECILIMNCQTHTLLMMTFTCLLFYHV